ncbi:E3 ubiquitin/ISG15 ligase TRIM25 [Xenopus tropicalis]|uniref:E3 ubiquitin/ISG15 ligase TRIM25 n=2 Tax=Xenopus tropicalis TaxID=8364 RepID=A0A8J0QRU7_XENTR|nr:E3 ubiquitin/ISG15 ligase TRIM25 [Xenopus tropicalis]
MAAADLRDELSCSICLSIYTDPVSLPCGHNFCRGCIGLVLGTQEGSGAYSCPECRAEYQECPALPRNRALGNIAERFRPTETEPGETGIFCTYCLLSPVPAAKSCLLCEASFCNKHLRGHSQSAEHVLTEPTASFMGRKCSVHHKVLEYHCCVDSACICVSCCLAGGHRGHRVELLSEASEKKKEKLRKVLEKLSSEREETERGAQRLQERRRESEIKAAGERKRVTALFRSIREELEALEKRLLSDISRQREELSLQLKDLIQQLEIKKDELSRKIRHIEELCNMADPLTFLQEQWESHGAAFCGAERGDRKRRNHIKVPAVGDLDACRISETLLTGLAGIVTGVEGWHIYGQEATELALDINMAGNRVSVSGYGISASYSHTAQCRPQTPERFQYSQALSSRRFPSGRHYWEVDGSKSGRWGVGVAYPSIERGGGQSLIGNNNKSWCLYRWNNNYTVRYDWKDTQLPHVPSCRRIRISLDYEAGRLSFYELSEPIRHLHTFTASFTEPLHAAFWVGGGACVRIISYGPAHCPAGTPFPELPLVL